MADLAVRVASGDVSSQDVERIVTQLKDAETITIGDVTVHLDPSTRATLIQVFGHLAAGPSIEVVPAEEWLTTSEAATLLRVSRPTLVHMLESGLIPFDRPAGVHRKVARSAVDAFISERHERRRAALDELAQTENPASVDEFVTTR